MSAKSSLNRATEVLPAFLGAAVAICALSVLPACASDAPPWMHAVVNTTVTPVDDKADAAVLFSEEIVTVQSADKVRSVVRAVYKILRPGGRDHGVVVVSFNPHRKITGMRGWCIPATGGKDYEVRDKDAVITSLPKIEGSELVTDVKEKILRIPAADVGSIIGYEYEIEEQPFVLQDVWYLQRTLPVREARYTLQLPTGWEYKSTWVNAPEAKPIQSGTQWQWTVTNVPGIRTEDDMPPLRRVAGHMIVSFFPAGGTLPGRTFADWQQMGAWYNDLARGRADSSQEIRQKVAALTSSAATPVEKIRAIAGFLQSDVRYVAIELGIGGLQPHAAPEIFTHHYGDCKDKATLMKAMLHDAGIDSYYVVINTRRGAVAPDMQAYLAAFNHVVLAIRLPDGTNDDSLYATVEHPRLGKLLFFDPTNQLVPLGQLGGYLQSNYGLLVGPSGGELIELPRQATKANGIERVGRLTLEANGSLRGAIEEKRYGDRAWEHREVFRNVTKDSDRIKPIESLLSHSLGTFQITTATVSNVSQTALPLGYSYSFVSVNYAKSAGDLLLLRPRVVGQKSSGLLETKEARKFPVEFGALARDSDSFEITLPPGYEVEDLPAPVNAEYSFAAYHSKSQVNGNVLRYTRNFEIKEFTVPLSKIDDLKKLYRIIAADERNNAVLKPVKPVK